MVSKGTALAHGLAAQYRKPELVVDIHTPNAIERTIDWLRACRRDLGAGLSLAIGGPRESEASGIYDLALVFIRELLTQA